jgi:Lrp/AsnC family leucine-responsive transcriptional regulator
MPTDLTARDDFAYSPTHSLLDAVNLRLLAELVANPRLPMTELGRRIGMSSPAVAERVRRLEEAGVIRGWRIDVDPAALGLPLTAHIRVRPSSGRLAEVATLAASIPEVTECHRVTGEDCFVLTLHLPTMDQLDRVLDRFLRLGTTTTSIVQSSPVPPRPLPIPVP